MKNNNVLQYNQMKRALFLISFFLLLTVIFVMSVNAVLGYGFHNTPTTSPTLIPQCKHLNSECEINNSFKTCCPGLTCVAFNEHSGNYKCKELPTPTPTATPTLEPTIEPTPTASASATPTPIEECDGDCKTPIPTPEPTDPPHEDRWEFGGAPQNPSCDAPKWAPTAYLDSFIEGSATFHWTTVKDGLHTYWVNWGQTQGNLDQNFVVEGETKIIDHLQPGHVFFRVAGYDNACTGPFSIIIDP